MVSEEGFATSGEVKTPVHVRCKGVGWSVTVERKNQQLSKWMKRLELQ